MFILLLSIVLVSLGYCAVQTFRIRQINKHKEKTISNIVNLTVLISMENASTEATKALQSIVFKNIMQV